MDSIERNRIDRLLESVEREEEHEHITRPLGAFRRELFQDEDNNENINIDDNDDTEDLEGILVLDVDNNDDGDGENIPLEDVYQADEIPGNLLEKDLEDLENVPLNIRKEGFIVERMNGRLSYISKDSKMLWDIQPTPQSLGRNRNILRMRMGHPTNETKVATTPVQAWQLFFTDEIINDISEKTNIWIQANQDNFSRQQNCKSTDATEIKAVFGLLFISGMLKSSHQNLRDLWSDAGFGVEFFRAAMSRERFQFLLRALRFDDINTREERKLLDRLAPIRDLVERIVEKNIGNYVLSEYVTVDEMLEAFRGRCTFRQYIRNKPAKYGVKIFALCDARTFYTSKLEIYAGKQPDGPHKVDNSGKSIVKRMVEPISGSGRNVTTDNWFTSIPLCYELLCENRLTLVGTLRKDKREIPREFIDTKDMPVGSSKFGFRDGCTMVTYKGSKKKNVILISSMHDDDMTDRDVDSPTFGKPEIVLFYNSSKGGVDTVDGYKEHYSVSRIANRWTMTVFYALLNITALNAYIILKANSGQSIDRRSFIKSLGLELCRDYMTTRISIKGTPRLTKELIHRLLGLERPQPQVAAPDDGVNEGRWFKCGWRKNRKTKTRCNVCRGFVCKEHTVPQCVDGFEGEEMDISDGE